LHLPFYFTNILYLNQFILFPIEFENREENKKKILIKIISLIQFNIDKIDR